MHAAPVARRTVRVLATAALLVLGLAASAQAAPGTVTGPNGLSLTVDDTTPAPGQTITLDWTYTMQAADAAAFAGSLGLGSPNHDLVNVEDVSLVSCAGAFSFYHDCEQLASFTGTNFSGDVETKRAGTVITGTADFVVSAAATNGEVIGFHGFYQSLTTHGALPFVFTTDRLDLTVDAPRADLGVALTATAAVGHVNYDAAITNNGADAATSATITTQLGSQAVSLAAGSGCTFSSSTHQVSCPVGPLANGATTHATFTINYALLSYGALNATATRTASVPTDPNAANDSASANCNATTSLLISC